MTDDTNEFRDALTTALNLSESYDEAFVAVRRLCDKFARTVKEMTDNKIDILLVPAGVPLAPPMLAIYQAAMEAIATPKPEFGGDVEDKQYRQLIVAKRIGATRSGDTRVLWEVELDEAGYPVTIRGPGEDTTESYYTFDDFRAGFLKAASHGLVGRKLHALAPRQRTVTESTRDEGGNAGKSKVENGDPSIDQ